MTTNTKSGSYQVPLVFLTSLFFMWGFMTSLNDILIPHLRNAFSLSYTQGMLIQFCFFGAYAIVSLPAAATPRIRAPPSRGPTVVPSELKAWVSVKRLEAVWADPSADT